MVVRENIASIFEYETAAKRSRPTSRLIVSFRGRAKSPKKFLELIVTWGTSPIIPSTLANRAYIDDCRLVTLNQSCKIRQIGRARKLNPTRKEGRHRELGPKANRAFYHTGSFSVIGILIHSRTFCEGWKK